MHVTSSADPEDHGPRPAQTKADDRSPGQWPPADLDQLALAQAYASLGVKAIEILSVAEARQQPTAADAIEALLLKQGRSAAPEDHVQGVTRRDIVVEGDTGPLPAYLYAPDGDGPFPVILFFHGGGWVLANKQVYDGGARGLAKHANAIVVSVDYRQAPEHKFPSSWEDALAAYAWTLGNAARFGGDPARVALAGESAGGNLAVATAIRARDVGLRAPVHVLSIYPLAQGSVENEFDLDDTGVIPLNRAMVDWYVAKVVATDDDVKDSRINLVDADLEGLPPVTIINASIDPLRGHGAKLETALREAGVSVARKSYDGVAHGFFGAASVLEKSRQAQAYAGLRLREAFGSL